MHRLTQFLREAKRLSMVSGVGLLTMQGALMAQPSSSAAQACVELSDSTKSAAIVYVQRKYHVPADVSPQLVDVSSIKGTCYRQLRFEGHTPESAFAVTLYASPDGRFLSSDLMDTLSDPIAGEGKQEQELMSKLSENAQLYAGPADALVTIVLFSDMQCPFCKSAAAMLKSEIRESTLQNVRLIYRHFPLPVHAWARAAAESATCVALQNRNAFWQMHDIIFENQNLLNANNIGTETERFAGMIRGLDMTAYRACVQNGTSAGLVARDFELGTANRVRATPTLFVNGRQVSPPRTPEELHEIISAAMSRASSERALSSSH